MPVFEVTVAPVIRETQWLKPEWSGSGFPTSDRNFLNPWLKLDTKLVLVHIITSNTLCWLGIIFIFYNLVGVFVYIYPIRVLFGLEPASRYYYVTECLVQFRMNLFWKLHCPVKGCLEKALFLLLSIKQWWAVYGVITGFTFLRNLKCCDVLSLLTMV